MGLTPSILAFAKHKRKNAHVEELPRDALALKSVLGGGGRFFKTLLCANADGLVVVKAFGKRVGVVEELDEHRDRLECT